MVRLTQCLCSVTQVRVDFALKNSGQKAFVNFWVAAQ